MSPRIGTEVAHRDTPLKWNVFVIKRQGLTRDLPPGKEQWMWGPTSATLISGQSTEQGDGQILFHFDPPGRLA